MKKQKNPVSKIKSISIEGFRAFNKRQEFPVRQINLIFGPNSSGKSALIKGIIYSLEEGDTKQLDLNGLNRFAANGKHEKGSCRFSYELDVNSFPRITDRKHLSEDMKETLFNLPDDQNFTFTHFVDTLNYPGNHGYALEYGDYKVFNENYFDEYALKSSIVPFWNRLQSKIDELFNSNRNVAKYLDMNAQNYIECIKKLSTQLFCRYLSFDEEYIALYNEDIFNYFVENNYCIELYTDTETSDQIRFDNIIDLFDGDSDLVNDKGIKLFKTIQVEISRKADVVKTINAQISKSALANEGNTIEETAKSYLDLERMEIQRTQNNFIQFIVENKDEYFTDNGLGFIYDIENSILKRYFVEEKEEEMDQDIFNGVSWAFDEIRDADKSDIVSDSSIRSLRDMNITKSEICSYTAELIILAVHDIKQIYKPFFEFRPADVAKMLYLSVERESVDFSLSSIDLEKSPLNGYLRDSCCIDSINTWFEKAQIPFELLKPESKKGEDSGRILSGSYNLPIDILDKRVDTVFPLKDVGYGLKKLIPVLAAVSYKYGAGGYHDKLGKYNLVAIEEPEIHLHPKLQSELGDLFVDSVIEGSGKIYFIETHSENLLQRILRRVREGAISHDAVNVLYVHPSTGNEGARVERLEIDDEGEFKTPWPKGFFDAREDDILA